MNTGPEKSPGKEAVWSNPDSAHLLGFLALGDDKDSPRGSMEQSEQFLSWKQTKERMKEKEAKNVLSRKASLFPLTPFALRRISPLDSPREPFPPGSEMDS